MTAIEKGIMENLCMFIKKNSNLLHLDLSHMSIHTEMIKEIGPAMTRAKSMIALHLSGNPGVTKDVKKYFRQRIRTVPKYRPIHIDHIDRDEMRDLHAHTGHHGGFKPKSTKDGIFKAGQQLKQFARD